MTSDDIRAIRANLSESQADFARRLGIHQTTVHRWERNGVPKDQRTQAFLQIALTQCKSGEPKT